MAFVYQGAGKKIPANADITLRECKDQACAIQWCLAKNNHKEDRCRDIIDAWKLCCEKARSSEIATIAKKGTERVTRT